VGTVTVNQTSILSDTDNGEAGNNTGTSSEVYIQGSLSWGARANATSPEGVIALTDTNANASTGGDHIGVWIKCFQAALVNDLEIAFSDRTGTSGGNNIGNNYSAITADTSLPPEGGWQRIWVNMSQIPLTGSGSGTGIGATRVQGGNIALNNINAVGAFASFTSTFAVNFLNLYVDGADFLSSGTSAFTLTGASSVFTDMSTEDNTNAHGVFRSSGGTSFEAYAPVQIGSATATAFTDTGSTVIFPVQNICSDDFMGLTIDISNASSSARFTRTTIQSADTRTTGEKRGKLEISGSAGSATFTDCNLLDLISVTLNNGVVVDGGQIRTRLVSQNGAEIKNGAIRLQNNTANSNNSGIVNSTFGTNSGLHDVNIIAAVETGTQKHALEINQSVTLTNIRFTGYDSGTDANGGSTGNASSAIISNAASDITITCDGTTVTSEVTVLQNGTGAVTVVGQPVNFTLNALKDGTEVRLIEAATNSSICGVETVEDARLSSTGIDNGFGTVTVTGSTDNNTFNFAYQYGGSPTNIFAAIISGSSFEIIYQDFVLGADDFSTSIAQQDDRNFNNPA
jgi:hypothetical protein